MQLSLQTYEPSETFLTSTLSAAATRASQIRLAEKGLARKIHVSSGQRCYALLLRQGHVACLTKMFQEAFLTGSWIRRSAIWKVRATAAGRPLLYLQVPSEPFTSEKGYGLLPTPMFKDGKGYYVSTREAALKRVGRNIHWMHKAMLFYNLKKGWANPRFSEYLMGYPPQWIN